jgi:hypothetical protein
VVRHDWRLFEYSPVRQKPEPAPPQVAVVSIEAQSAQRKIPSSQFAVVPIVTARWNRQLDCPAPLVIAMDVRPQQPQLGHLGFVGAALPKKL